MRKTKQILSLFLVTALLLSMMACGNKDESTAQDNGATQSDTAEKIPLKISHHPYLHGLPSVYAEENGLYDIFDYTIDYYSGGPVQNEAIASGAWEVGTTGMGGAVLGVAGYDLKVIGVTIPDENTVDLWARPDSDIVAAGPDENGVYGTADDWRGKRILCATGTSCHMALISTLNYLGLTEDDVEIIDTAVAQSYTAFKAGEADVVALWSPFGFAAESDEDWVMVSSATATGLEMPCLIVATAEAVENRPEVVSQWLERFLQATDALREDPEMSAQMLYDFEEEQGISMTEEAAKQDVEHRPFPTLEENKAYFEDDGNGSNHIEQIVLQFTDFMISQGKLTEADKQHMIDTGFVDGSFILGIDG